MNSRQTTMVILAACFVLTPRARGDFANVINVPPSVIAPGTIVSANTQVNLYDGAPAVVSDVLHLGDDETPADNTELNVLGGGAWAIEAWDGSQVNVIAGSLGTVNLLGSRGAMFGGTVKTWELFASSHLEMSGGFAARINTAGLTEGVAPDTSSFTMAGGEVGILHANGNVTIHGGTIDSMYFNSGGFAEITGGSIGDDFEVGHVVIGAFPDDPARAIVDGTGGHVIVRGGSIGARMILRAGRSLDYSGGIIGDAFQALDGSQVNILGDHFLIDGVEQSVPAGASLIVTQRNVVLAGLLANGEPFQFDLDSYLGNGDYFSHAAIVTITSVPEPATAALLIAAALVTTICRHTLPLLSR